MERYAYLQDCKMAYMQDFLTAFFYKQSQNKTTRIKLVKK